MPRTHLMDDPSVEAHFRSQWTREEEELARCEDISLLSMGLSKASCREIAGEPEHWERRITRMEADGCDNERYHDGHRQPPRAER